MPGLLGDVNLQGHLPYPEVGLDPATDDRAVSNFCQANEWVLFTDNRNREDEDSLCAVLDDPW